MKPWPKYPITYEINTWVWLNELTKKYQKKIDLSTVPDEEWDALASYGFDNVWLMGVWERSPAGIEISLQNKGLLENFKRVLSDFTTKDNVGSPYCVRSYVVDEHLGGQKGLAIARNKLRKHGIRLILDFIPNHVAPDHSWTVDHPEYFIQGNHDDMCNDPTSFIQVKENVIACGKDPYFPAWPDVVQLNPYHHGLRQAVIDIISKIAEQCDGIRCDMAMLMLNHIVEKTWGARAENKPHDEYWKTIIQEIKQRYPEFKFIAEAYWDLEWQLQQEGFDYCYDKKLYDRMVQGDPESVRQHLLADPSYQEKMMRFIENHDEPRASTVFSAEKERAAAVVMLTLCGAKLLYAGQFEGMKMHLSVFLGRQPTEPIDHDLSTFYSRLMKAINRDVFRNGEWGLCEKSGWPDNQSHLNVLSWFWFKGDECYLVIINFSPQTSQGRIIVPCDKILLGAEII